MIAQVIASATTSERCRKPDAVRGILALPAPPRQSLTYAQHATEVLGMAPDGLDMSDRRDDTRVTEQARCSVPTAIVAPSDTHGRRSRP
jgi:hypothetical protein